MKRYLFTVLLTLLPFLAGAQINITNITKSATVTTNDYVLGTTGLVTRLLPVSGIAALATSGTVQTNISYTAVTNAPWQWGDSDLTNWASLGTNVLSTLVNQTNWPYTAITNAPWITTGFGSTNCLYSSLEGCVGDSDVLTGGGTDDTLAIQAMLNQATNGPVEIVIERPSLISTTLVIYGNTLLRGNPGAGFYMADNSDSEIMVGGGLVWPPVGITNVVIQDLTMNGNSLMQESTNSWFYREFGDTTTNNVYWNKVYTGHGIRIQKGDNILVRNVTMLDWGASVTNQPATNALTIYCGFGMWFQDIGHLVIDNCTFKRNPFPGNDCIHFWGPMGEAYITRCVFENYRTSPAGAFVDDAIALNLAEQSAYRIASNNLHTAGYFHIENVRDKSSRQGVVNLRTDYANLPPTDAGVTSTYCITNLVIKHVYSDFSGIVNLEQAATPGGRVISMYVENIHDTAVQVGNMIVDNLYINGLFCDTAPPGTAVDPLVNKGSYPWTAVTTGVPLYPVVRIGGHVTNTVIANISGTWNNGYDIPIVASVFQWGLETNAVQPHVNINGVNVRGNSPLYADKGQNYASVGVCGKSGTVVLDNIIADGELIVSTNRPALEYRRVHATNTALVGQPLLSSDLNGVGYWGSISGTNIIGSGNAAEYLKGDGTWGTPSATATYNALDDVATNTLADGDIMIWDDGNAVWTNYTPTFDISLDAYNIWTGSNTWQGSNTFETPLVFEGGFTNSNGYMWNFDGSIGVRGIQFGDAPGSTGWSASQYISNNGAMAMGGGAFVVDSGGNTFASSYSGGSEGSPGNAQFPNGVNFTTLSLGSNAQFSVAAPNIGLWNSNGWGLWIITAHSTNFLGGTAP